MKCKKSIAEKNSEAKFKNIFRGISVDPNLSFLLKNSVMVALTEKYYSEKKAVSSCGERLGKYS